MAISKTTLKSFSLKRRISKEEFLAASPQDVEKITYETADGLKLSVFFSNKSPINRKLNRVPVIYDDDTMEVERYSTLALLNARKNRTKDGTVSSIAQGLVEFLKFCEENQIDWRVTPRNKLKKPIYRYSRYLQTLIYDGVLAPSTAKRKISTVIRFYKDCQNDYGSDFFGVHPPYTDKMVTFTDPKGKTRLAVTQEEQIKVTKETPADSQLYIEDGGKLKSLMLEEQEVLHEILDSNKVRRNIEMRYIFKTALKTGARLQTILTLSVKDIDVHIDLPSGYSDINHIVRAGRSHIADSKRSKDINIFIPYSWIEALKVYVNGPRYQKRREKYFKNLGITNPTEEQLSKAYLFLTNRGTPYYDRKSDLKVYNPNNTRGQPRIGGGVHDYLAEHILPVMREKLGEGFRFHFHDLRATYGVNLRDQLREIYPEADSEEIYKQIQARLSHNDRKTTEDYVKYEPTGIELINLEHKYREDIGITVLTESQVNESLTLIQEG
ncbi:site-specific integrase [Thiomicrorhabdus lithotrophica]|uniref:Site-specific integrase n=1 Tax=Thiomicrorhabdus lithotrophica TaxID=2949997 RepID=A0ABY8C9K4_9GAMM|nr:site-specific integrase [Thiomicrorhabdus lithotrophica]WEJ62648.1 site-specific integrase [Thiomicrorhabdus lithotrophica]